MEPFGIVFGIPFGRLAGRSKHTDPSEAARYAIRGSVEAVYRHAVRSHTGPWAW
jgi:hypothetical protein